MVRIGGALLRDAERVGVGINKILSEILVCPLTKQPLRVCEESGRLISDAAGVSFPVNPSSDSSELQFQFFKVELVLCGSEIDDLRSIDSLFQPVSYKNGVLGFLLFQIGLVRLSTAPSINEE